MSHRSKRIRKYKLTFKWCFPFDLQKKFFARRMCQGSPDVCDCMLQFSSNTIQELLIITVTCQIVNMVSIKKDCHILWRVADGWKNVILPQLFDATLHVFGYGHCGFCLCWQNHDNFFNEQIHDDSWYKSCEFVVINGSGQKINSKSSHMEPNKIKRFLMNDNPIPEFYMIDSHQLIWLHLLGLFQSIKQHNSKPVKVGSNDHWNPSGGIYINFEFFNGNKDIKTSAHFEKMESWFCI